MLTNRAALKFTTALAVVGLLQAQILPPIAFAQPAQPPSAPGADNRVQTADPPTRAGRLARISGNVGFHPADADHWDRAVLNYPVTTGYSFSTEANAQADLEVAASRIVMDSQTEIDVTALDATNVALVLPQGEVYLRLRSLVPNETYTLQTPRGTVTISTNGRYGIFAGDTGSPTRITVLEGAAHVSGPNVALDIGPNQTGLIEGTDSFTGRLVAAQIDDFLRAQLDRERPPAPQAVAPPPAVAAMPGGEELSSYGTWASTTDYGQVWYPRVDTGWVPYRDGHWAWVAPWGWTWVDDAPWGFAPSHYGRWVEIGDRWAWAPGFYDPGVAYWQPVYAPALVSFFDFGAGVALGLGVGLAIGGSIGWCPLGWGEPYRPWFHVSNNYFVNVNVHNVQNINITNITAINSNVTINNFANRRAMMTMSTAAMTNSAPVNRFAQRVDPRQLGAAHPVVGRAPLDPTRATSGVSAGIARRMSLPAGQAGAAGSAGMMRGPAIGTGPARAGQGGLPPLVGAGRGGPGRAGLAPLARAGSAAPAPGGLPSLRGGHAAAPGAAGSQLPALREGRGTAPPQPGLGQANRGSAAGPSFMNGRSANAGRAAPLLQPPRNAPGNFGQRSYATPRAAPQISPHGYERSAPTYAAPRVTPRQNATPQYGAQQYGARQYRAPQYGAQQYGAQQYRPQPPQQFSAPRQQEVIPQGDGGPPARHFGPTGYGGGAYRQPAPRSGGMSMPYGGGGPSHYAAPHYAAPSYAAPHYSAPQPRSAPSARVPEAPRQRSGPQQPMR